MRNHLTAILCGVLLAAGASSAWAQRPVTSGTSQGTARPRATPRATPPQQGVPATAIPTPPSPNSVVSPSQNTVTPPSLGQPLGTQTPSPGVLIPATPLQVANSQIMLQGLGLYRGPINGLLTGPTRAALRKFQLDAHVPVTGHPDPQTLFLLGTGSGVVQTPANTADSEFRFLTGETVAPGAIPVDSNNMPQVIFIDPTGISP